LVRLAENSSTTSNQHLHLEKEVNDQLTLNHIRSNLHMVRRLPPRVFPVNKPVVHAAPVTPLVSKVAKTEEKPKEDAQKDADRRKQRQKSLEEKAAQTAQTKPPTPPAPTFAAAAPTAPDYPASYAGLATGAGAPPTNSTTTNPNATTTTQTPLGASHVSTLSNNGAVSGWITLLTTDPTAAEMTSFESQYTKNAITQAEYYQVLTAMQASSNSESRNFAVQGAALYQNISSFKILADESKNESVASVASAATSDLNAYENANDITILNTAATSGDAAEQAVAKAFLQIIAGTSPGTPAGVAATSARL
jgi:hypothetical protein